MPSRYCFPYHTASHSLSTQSQVIALPENNGSMKVMVDGACNDSSMFQLVVTWIDETNYTVTMDFLNVCIYIYMYYIITVM